MLRCYLLFKSSSFCASLSTGRVDVSTPQITTLPYCIFTLPFSSYKKIIAEKSELNHLKYFYHRPKRLAFDRRGLSPYPSVYSAFDIICTTEPQAIRFLIYPFVCLITLSIVGATIGRPFLSVFICNNK